MTGLTTGLMDGCEVWCVCKCNQTGCGCHEDKHPGKRVKK